MGRKKAQGVNFGMTNSNKKGLKYKIESILKLRQMIREELGLGDYND